LQQPGTPCKQYLKIYLDATDDIHNRPHRDDVARKTQVQAKNIAMATASLIRSSEFRHAINDLFDILTEVLGHDRIATGTVGQVDFIFYMFAPATLTSSRFRPAVSALPR
jgi:hypothetical protein